MGWLRKLWGLIKRPIKRIVTQDAAVNVIGELVSVIITGVGEVLIDRKTRQRLRDLNLLLEGALAKLREYGIVIQKERAFKKALEDFIDHKKLGTEAQKWVEERITKISEEDIEDPEIP